MGSIQITDAGGFPKYMSVNGSGTVADPYIPLHNIFPANMLDANNRLITASPEGLWDTQFTYDLQPLLFEQITNGTGATVTFDAVNRCAVMAFSSTPTGGKAYMQSYEYLRYQPGKSQQPILTFNFVEAIANCTKFARYGDASNSFSFENNGTQNQFAIYSATTSGNQIAGQSSWNIDKMDGSRATGGANNPSGLTLDITKEQLFYCDIAALYTDGAVMGFQVGGVKYPCHRFSFANSAAFPFIQSANLPISVGMTCTGTVTTTMRFHCSAVFSSGGAETVHGNEFLITNDPAVLAGANAWTHAISMRPKALFNGITNRVGIYMLEISVAVLGTNSVRWQLRLGQAITGVTTFTDVNTTYSATEYNTAGTLSGNPAIIIDGETIPASNQQRGSDNMVITHKYPLTLDAAGVVRLLGTMTLALYGIGGTSAVDATLKITEVR